MRVKNKLVVKLLEKYKEISILGKIGAVLDWDLNVNLPPKASEGRANQSAYLTEIIVDKWLDPGFRNLLEKASEESSYAKATEDEAAIIRNLNWAAKFYYKVPKEIIVEKAKSTSKAFMVWQEAKAKNDFISFRPHLEKIIKLDQVVAEHLGYKENRYDALLDLFEPGLTTSFLRETFGFLQKELTEILKKIQRSKIYKETNQEEKNYPIDDQRQLSTFVLKRMRYDLNAGRMDISSHPFTNTLDRFDVRITNRYKTNDFKESLMVAMHEGGHALYEQGVNEKYAGTPLDGGVSLGIHESQSRFWENQIGRSEAFLTFMTPIFHAFYHEQLSDFGAETFTKMFNGVKPGLIRVEADEVTYNLHIILRFELEEAMINGKIKVKDLPEFWRQMMKKYLGVFPKTDREGVLQDVHWAYGSFGYFPTYTLGNLYAAQIAKKMSSEINVSRSVGRGELGTILSWLRTNIHRYGSLYWPKELIKKVTGETLNPKYFMDYIKDKYSKIYNISL